jgi:uncharacterized SAM-dependent methyltransferase
MKKILSATTRNSKNFNPAKLGKSLCMNFDAVRSAFAEEPDKRINGTLSGYIYDIPQFPDDPVRGGIHYARYVKLASSLIPQRQPSLLQSFAKEIQEIVPLAASFFDLGPGPEWSVKKNTVPAMKILKPSVYVPVDLEPEFTEEACNVVSSEFPDMEVKHLVSNFHAEPLPSAATENALVWYPGSTLGNLPSLPETAFIDNRFVMKHLAMLGKGAAEEQARYLVLLMDRKKEDIQSMLDLYASDDAVGCFLSILFKLKRDLQAEDFDPTAFAYKPLWNEQASAVEHSFTATANQLFRIHDCFTNVSETVKISVGECYILANSMKPSHDDMQDMLARSGWKPLQSAEDASRQFHIHLAQACPEKGAQIISDG